MNKLNTVKFPRDFVWGAATSAYQIEGATTEDGRGQSIWDTFARVPGMVADGTNGDVACDHYHRLESDLDLMSELGLPAYRFSVAWPRIQPEGSGRWNPKGLDFYDRLVDGLLERNIDPYVTLYHWDLPQGLQDQGGWLNRDTAYRFAEYAQYVVKHLGDRLSSIATHNEPAIVSLLGYLHGVHPPGVKSMKAAMQAAHNLLLSHGLAVRALRSVGTRAPVGIVLNPILAHPASDDPEDVASTKLFDGISVRWYMDALTKGRYPQDVMDHLGAGALVMKESDLDIICSPIDFLGINYYTREVFERNLHRVQGTGELGFTDIDWEIYPRGLYELLTRLDRDYMLPPIYITENGAAYDDVLKGDRVHDHKRTHYLRLHLAALADAITDGVDVRGYFAWSLLDNFEWSFGYAKRFGLVHVDYNTQRRIIKDSGRWFKALIASQTQGKSARRSARGDRKAG
jgi:beta-glucosidase